jgi:hypothetical protein
LCRGCANDLWGWDKLAYIPMSWQQFIVTDFLLKIEMQQFKSLLQLRARSLLSVGYEQNSWH